MSKMTPAPVRSEVGNRPPPRTSEVTYMEVTEAFRKDGGSEARALRMMFPTKQEQDRYLAVVFGLLARESDILQTCTSASIIDSIKVAGTMGLEPGTTDGSLIRRGNKCTFLPEYGGYLKRIRNSGKVQDVDTQLVYEHDDFSYRLGTDPVIEHVPTLDDRGNITHVYAWALMNSGKYLIDVLDRAEINLIRDTYGSKDKQGNLVGPWVTSYGEMSRKTAIRRLSKRLPQDAVAQLLVADAIADDTAKEVRRISDGMENLRTLASRAVSGPSDQQEQAAEPKPEAAAVEATSSSQDASRNE